MSTATPQPNDSAATSAMSTPRIVAASAIGTAVEWYDFFLFGTASALVFNKLFFPSLGELTGTLAAFATFGAGFIARPIGGIVCGHIGDRVGRKKTLVLVLILMGVATFCVGLLPTYNSIGVWAPVLLVVLRLVQGFGVGGELTGAQLMCIEYAPPGKRGFYGSWPQAASPVGLSMATGLILPLSIFLSEEQFLLWGWRIPFLISIFLVVVGLVIRLKVFETPHFRRMLEVEGRSRVPALDVIRQHKMQVLRAVGMYVGVTVVYYACTVFMLAYATSQLGMSRNTALAVSLAANAVAFVTLVAGGALSDRFGRRRTYIASALLVGAMAFPGFLLVNTATTAGLFFGTVMLGTGLYCYAGIQGSFFAEMFPTRVRYSAMSLGLTIATLIGGAITPSLLTTLVISADGSSWIVSTFLVGIALITAISAYSTKDTHSFDDSPLPDAEAGARSGNAH